MNMTEEQYEKMWEEINKKRPIKKKEDEELNPILAFIYCLVGIPLLIIGIIITLLGMLAFLCVAGGLIGAVFGALIKICMLIIGL